MEFISLEDTKKIKLDKRVCTKYVLSIDMLQYLVDFIIRNFKITKDSTNKIIFKYHSIYFDTNDFQSNRDYVNNKSHRQKIRIREYESNDKFLEIKDKDNHISKKIRIPINSNDIHEYQQWISSNLIYDFSKLSKKLDISFYRITLVDSKNQYRVTLDFNIEYFNYITNRIYISKEVVLEVKKPRIMETFFEEGMKKILKEKYPEFSSIKFSKYNFGLKNTCYENY